MPRFSTTLYDAEGKAVGIACGRTRQQKCAAPGCCANAQFQCDFPVERDGTRTTCDRWVCAAHRKRIGRNLDHCPAHARAEERR